MKTDSAESQRNRVVPMYNIAVINLLNWNRYEQAIISTNLIFVTTVNAMTSFKHLSVAILQLTKNLISSKGFKGLLTDVIGTNSGE